MNEIHPHSRRRRSGKSTARAFTPDPLARLLEAGLALFVVIAPLPYGAVPAGGRLALEIGAFSLLALWTVRACVRPAHLPSKLILVGLLGMLGTALLQAVPIGVAPIELLSPRALEIHTNSRPDQDIQHSEVRFLGLNPTALEEPATLSVDRVATASALRTGAAYVAVFIVACTVAATCGVRRLAIALLFGASFQALYGILVLSSETPHIWHLSKKYYLESATGSFVNRNHFACLISMSLACGIALILSNARRTHRLAGRNRILHMFSGTNSQNLVLGVLLVLAAAGALTSFSRAGIGLGLMAMVLTVICATRFRRPRESILVVLLLVAAAAMPLLQIGSGRLVERFGKTTTDLFVPGGRITVWKDTLTIARDFPVIGTGYGTYAYAYPFYRAPEVRVFYAHAHHDLLQSLAEGGVIGLAFLLLVLLPTLKNVTQSLTGSKGILAIGFAAGLTAVLLHSLVDFNFHIPANGAIAAILAGTLEGLPWAGPASS